MNDKISLLNSSTASKLIGQSTAQELKEAFTKAFLMVGLRPQHYPNEIEQAALFQYLMKQYPGLSIAAFCNAFHLAIQRKLPIDDIAVFDNFSIEYMVRILNAYKVYTRIQIENRPKNPEPIAMLPAAEKTLETMAADLKEWTEIKVSPNMLPLFLYDNIVALGLFDNSKYGDYIDKAKSIRESELQAAILNGGGRASREDFREFGSLIADEVIKDKNVERIAKRLIISDYIKSQRKI